VVFVVAAGGDGVDGLGLAIVVTAPPLVVTVPEAVVGVVAVPAPLTVEARSEAESVVVELSMTLPSTWARGRWAKEAIKAEATASRLVPPPNRAPLDVDR